MVGEHLQAPQASPAPGALHKALGVIPEHRLSAELCSDDPTQQACFLYARVLAC